MVQDSGAFTIPMHQQKVEASKQIIHIPHCSTSNTIQQWEMQLSCPLPWTAPCPHPSLSPRWWRFSPTILPCLAPCHATPAQCISDNLKSIPMIHLKNMLGGGQSPLWSEWSPIWVDLSHRYHHLKKFSSIACHQPTCRGHFWLPTLVQP